VATVGARCVEEAVETLGISAKPRSTESLLAACLAERCGANQWLPGVGPAIRMSATSVVVVQVRGQTCDEFLGRCEVAAFQEATGQGAEPQFDLVEPRTVLGREVEDMLVIGIGQEGASLFAVAQFFLVERQAVEFRQEFANLQAPMGIQVIEDPMAALVVGKLRRDMSQMGGEIDAGACHAQVPHDLASGDDKRSDQATSAVADVFVLAFFGLAWLGQNRGVFSFEDLHAGFFVGANDHLALLIEDGSLDVQLADVLSLGVEVGIVAVEPIDTAMGFEVGRIQDTPDGGARHRLVGVAVDQLGREIVEAPLAGDAIMVAGFAGGQGDDFELFVGGKSSVADRNAEHLAGQRDRAEESVCATERPCCEHSRTRYRPASWTADPWLPIVRSADNERLKLAGWNGLGSKPPSVPVFQGPRQSQVQMDLA